MSVEIKGLDEFIGKLDKAVKTMPKKRNKLLKQSAENLICYTKDLTPVDTSRLKNSWQRSRPYSGSIKVFNPVEYASHVEYGHRIKNRKDEWVKDEKGKIKFVKGVYMLHQGMEELKDNFEDDARIIIGDIFD